MSHLTFLRIPLGLLLKAIEVPASQCVLNRRNPVAITRYLSHAYCSSSSNCEPGTLLENEVQEVKVTNSKRKLKDHISRLILQTIGSGAPGSPKSLFVAVETYGLLFNCGENTYRHISECARRFSSLTHVFVTFASWENVSGMPCLQEAISKTEYRSRPSFSTFGPIGLVPLMRIFRSFRGDTDDKSMNYKDMREGVIEVVNGFTVQSVPLFSSRHEDTELRETKFMKRELISELKKKNYTLAYICSCPVNPGAVSITGMIEADVPPGPLVDELKNGNTVTLEDGRVVTPEHVSTGVYNACSFIVIEIPNTDYLDSLASSQAFAPFQEREEPNDEGPLEVIVHFSPSEVMRDPRYLQWVNSFSPSVTHLVLNDKNTCVGLQRSLKLQIMLNHLQPTIFPMLHDSNILSREGKMNRKIEELPKLASRTEKYQFRGPTVQSSTYLQYCLRPSKKFDSYFCREVYVEDVMEDGLMEDDVQERIKEMKKEFYKHRLKHQKSPSYPNILFLGTGSACPSSFRSVTGILVNLSPVHCMLLDCGEATVCQLIRSMGLEKAHETLRQLEVVSVSHHHVDHFTGLPALLIEREKAFNKIGKQPRPIIFLIDGVVSQYVRDVHFNFYPILKNVILSSIATIKKDGKYFSENLYRRICNVLRLTELEVTPVPHCASAYAISFTDAAGFKVTYSGDTLPSNDLVRMGMGSDLLIHEATFEEGMETAANLKKHSTVSQALQVAKDMEARFTILTHFSQRYAHWPPIRGSFPNNVGIAFDYMKVGLGDLHYLPIMYPVMEKLFVDQFEEMKMKKFLRELEETK